MCPSQDAKDCTSSHWEKESGLVTIFRKFLVTEAVSSVKRNAYASPSMHRYTDTLIPVGRYFAILNPAFGSINEQRLRNGCQISVNDHYMIFLVIIKAMTIFYSIFAGYTTNSGYFGKMAANSRNSIVWAVDRRWMEPNRRSSRHDIIRPNRTEQRTVKDEYGTKDMLGFL